MRRTFSEHAGRAVTSLDGLWQLTPQDGSGRAFSAMVPGVWERIPALAAYRGTAEYVRRVTIEAPGHYLLRMGGVSHTARVFWDGVQVGEHYNAFTGFDVLLKDVTAGVHELCVSIPHWIRLALRKDESNPVSWSSESA